MALALPLVSPSAWYRISAAAAAFRWARNAKHPCTVHWAHVKEPKVIKINWESGPITACLVIMSWFWHVKPQNFIFSSYHRSSSPSTFANTNDIASSKQADYLQDYNIFTNYRIMTLVSIPHFICNHCQLKIPDIIMRAVELLYAHAEIIASSFIFFTTHQIAIICHITYFITICTATTGQFFHV